MTTSDDNNERGKIFFFYFFRFRIFYFTFHFLFFSNCRYSCRKLFHFASCIHAHDAITNVIHYYFFSVYGREKNCRNSIKTKPKAWQGVDRHPEVPIHRAANEKANNMCVDCSTDILNSSTRTFLPFCIGTHTPFRGFPNWRKAKRKEESKLKIRHRKTLLYWNISELSALWVCASCCCSEIYMYLFTEQREYFSLFFHRRRHRGLFQLPDVQITCHHIRNESLLISFS